MKKYKLGLVCISEELRSVKRGAYKSMTRKIFNSRSRSESIKQLSSRIVHNSCYVREVIEHIAKSKSRHGGHLSHLRLSSTIFPLLTDPTLNLTYGDLPQYDSIKSLLSDAGECARANGITLSSHPDQFNVLASYNSAVVENSIRELNHQAYVMDLFGCPQDHSAPMTLHTSCGPKFKAESLDDYVTRFTDAVARCDRGVQKRLVLENEDKGYWNCHNLYSSFNGIFPLVYDNLHDACNPSPVEHDWPVLFSKTWGDHTPVFHWSEGIDGTNKHTSRASHIPAVVQRLNDVIWEVELKDKDTAIFEICNNLNF
jgi:UV DNA damage endonuclease